MSIAVFKDGNLNISIERRVRNRQPDIHAGIMALSGVPGLSEIKSGPLSASPLIQAAAPHLLGAAPWH